VVRSKLRIAGAIAVAFAFPAHADQVPDRYPQIASAYLVQIGDRDLWSGRADERLPPASLTKIMTALLVLEDYRPAQVVTVSATAAKSTSSVKLQTGDRLTVEALLTATLLASANNACAALAETMAGNVSAFVAKMNERAQALGLTNTHFANPCGFDAPGHYSSARDLARLAHTALAHPEFAALVAKAEATIATVDGGRSFPLRNRNALVGSYAPAIGVKTGYTSGAGTCLIALAQKGDVRVLLVMLNAKRRWWDAIGVIENAFDEAAAHAAQ
jgi:serine-type D-Ala-D-Ala carboxypeptidase (penicillin-binding protein 5/6)